MSIQISVDTLRQMMAQEPTPRLVDVRWVLSAPGADVERARMRGQYLEGHLPGAVFVDLEHDLTGPLAGEPLGAIGGRHPLPSAEQMTATLQAAGVDDTRPVVLYDQGNGMAAARTWWLLTDAGLTNVSVLDGGLAAWQAAGGELESGEVSVEPTTWVAQPGHRERIDADEVARRIEAGHRVIDVRAGERYRGETEPLDPVAGHIPGAESVPDDEIAGPGLRERVGDLGPGDVLSCGSGVTAAHALMKLVDAGYEGVEIYPGSYSEWSRSGRPIA